MFVLGPTIDKNCGRGHRLTVCNLYRLKNSAAEVAALFDAKDTTAGSNRGEEVYPGYPGLVAAEGQLQTMVWGFPFKQRSKRTGEWLKPRPVNNARSDKLNGFMWRFSFERRRCLIPVSAWAEAEGPKGGKTRTWLSLPDRKLFACAGIWRESDEWGRCYSMVMTDAAETTREVHDRMPVILRADDHARWLEGTPEEAHELCVPWAGEIAIEKTDQPWSARG